MRRLRVVYKERIKDCNQVFGVFYSYKYDDNSYVIDIVFTTFKSEHYILILLGKSNIRS